MLTSGLVETPRLTPWTDAGVAASADDAAAATPKENLRAGQVGLDWFSFFLADIQTGFGPFVAVYLTATGWTQADIGLVLTAGGLAALAGQIPGGALVDAVRSPRLVASLAIVAICASALSLAVWPVLAVALAGRILHAGASCILGPALAAISLRLVGHGALGERIGRNARFAAIGSAVGAAAMGACGYLFSNQAVFLFAAALVLPALYALGQIRLGEDAAPAAGRRDAARARGDGSVRALLGNRALIVFAAAVVLFHLANAGMLPLMSGILTLHASKTATAVVAACMIAPQIVVALFAPWVGRYVQAHGRRPLLIACFAALALRGLLFSLVADPYAVIAIQLLDGISGAALGVLYPLIIADITRDTGRFNLALGIVGSALGIGASLSTMLAGSLFVSLGTTTFLVLAAVALAGLVLVWLVMPETRPEGEVEERLSLVEAPQA